MNELLDTALAAHAAGLCVLPPRQDGTKAPRADNGEWNQFESTRSTEAEIRLWYSGGLTGIGYVCGAVSGGLEALDFDDQDIYKQYKELVREAGLGDIADRIEEGYSEASPRGIHWLYRCSAIGGSTKLARRPKRPEEMEHENDHIKTLIESKGEGGYIIVAPSNGRVHPSGLPYRLLRGGVYTILTITPEEREELWELARSFDQMPRKTSEPHQDSTESSDVRPGDDFNQRADWRDILEPYGWRLVYQQNDVGYWRRPGKDRGISATTNYAGSGLLYIFSTSTKFDSERGYRKFAAYTVLNHSSDFRAAAKALAERGHGQSNYEPNGRKPSEKPETRPLTDYGNAERLVSQHGQDLRYCHPWKKWLIWDGARWYVDDTAEVTRRAKDTARSIYKEAAAILDPALRTSTARWAVSSESETRIEAMLALAASEPGIPILPETMDKDPWLLNCLNGTLDLRKGTLREHRREDLITKTTGVVYDYTAKAPLWEASLGAICQEDETLIQFLKRAAGYSLTGSTRERVLFIPHGGGHNGKSTFVETVALVIGDYASKTHTRILYEAKGDGGSRAKNDEAHLKGLRFVFASEGDQDKRLAEGEVKRLTGGDTLRGNFLYAEPFDFTPEFKLWFSTNHKPQIRGTDKAIWGRIRLIPFNAHFEGLKDDKNLKEKLAGELPGILNWLVVGCMEWQLWGLGESLAVQKATAAYRAEEDVLATFFTEVCIVTPTATVLRSMLYKAYLAWCESAGEKHVSAQLLNNRLRERGFSYVQVHGEGWTWQGLGLLQA